MKKKCMILLGALSLASSTFAQTWIWYPGDYEIWLGNQMNNRRTERGAFFPPFWKTKRTPKSRSSFIYCFYHKKINDLLIPYLFFTTHRRPLQSCEILQ